MDMVTAGRTRGVDFPYLLWQMMVGRPVPEQTARTGVRWIRMCTDVPPLFMKCFAAHKSRGVLALFVRPSQVRRNVCGRSSAGLLDLPYLPTSTFITHTRLCEKVFLPQKDVPLKVEVRSGGSGPISIDKRAVYSAGAGGPQNLLRPEFRESPRRELQRTQHQRSCFVA